MKVFTTEVKQKGRVLLPSGLREVAQFEEGTHLVAKSDKPGVVVLSTRAALLEDLQTGAPSHPVDVDEALRDFRQNEIIRYETLATSPSEDDPESDAGRVLLAQLGIE